MNIRYPNFSAGCTPYEYTTRSILQEYIINS